MECPLNNSGIRDDVPKGLQVPLTTDLRMVESLAALFDLDVAFLFPDFFVGFFFVGFLFVDLVFFGPLLVTFFAVFALLDDELVLVAGIEAMVDADEVAC